MANYKLAYSGAQIDNRLGEARTTYNEVVAARDSAANLKTRIDAVKAVADAAALKADAMASGSPVEAYATVGALEAALPTGAVGAYLVEADLNTFDDEIIITDEGTETAEILRMRPLALFDRVHAKDTGMLVDVDAQIVSIDYDAMRKRMNNMTIGKARSRLTGSIYTKPSGTWQSST